MNFRFLRRYLFLNLCLILTFIYYFTDLFFADIIYDVCKFISDFMKAEVRFFANIVEYAMYSYLLFLLEIPLRFLIMKFILKKEEVLTPSPKTKNKFLRFLDGFYTFLLSVMAFYGCFILTGNTLLLLN